MYIAKYVHKKYLGCNIKSLKKEVLLFIQKGAINIYSPGYNKNATSLMCILINDGICNYPKQLLINIPSTVPTPDFQMVS